MFKQSFVLALNRRYLDLFLGDLFAKELHPRRLRAANTTQTFVVDLQTELVNFSLKCTLSDSLAFKFAFEFINLRLQGTLLPVELLDFARQLLLVSRCNVEPLDRLLDVLQSALLFFFEYTAFLVVLLLALFAIGVEGVLVLLLDAKLGQLQLPLLVFAGQRDLLLLALELGFELLGECPLVFLQLDFPLLL